MIVAARIVAVVCLLAACVPCAAQVSCGFENGLGRNAQALGSDIRGMLFSTVSGGSVRYADINTGMYRVTSDNGKVYEDGEYFVSGDVAAFVVSYGDVAKVLFTLGQASYVTVGYTSQFQFVMEAYDAAGSLLTSTTSPANVKSQGGTGLQDIAVTAPGIAYVLMHDEGGCWMIDNIRSDAYVPEPSSMAILLALVGGIICSKLPLRRLGR